MLTEVKGDTVFSHLHIALNPGEQILARPGSIIGFETGLEVRTIFAEPRWQGLVKKCMGNPLLRVTRLRNIRDATRRVKLSPPAPGALAILELNNQSFQVQPDAFVACTQGVELADKLRSPRTPTACHGWFHRVVKGRGRIWLGTFGALVERELDGELTLNSRYLVACEQGITRCRYRSKLAGSMIRLNGRGKVLMQTRSCAAMAGWLHTGPG